MGAVRGLGARAHRAQAVRARASGRRSQPARHPRPDRGSVEGGHEPGDVPPRRPVQARGAFHASPRRSLRWRNHPRRLDALLPVHHARRRRADPLPDPRSGGAARGGHAAFVAQPRARHGRPPPRCGARRRRVPGRRGGRPPRDADPGAAPLGRRRGGGVVRAARRGAAGRQPHSARAACGYPNGRLGDRFHPVRQEVDRRVDPENCRSQWHQLVGSHQQSCR
mmetsp:Transcript_32755/g.104985  ORF Transcript_32755/g.104985 Transcript_32755/m.104985 type:complete len:223 (+) Transcript_32755:295-963(+)